MKTLMDAVTKKTDVVQVKVTKKMKKQIKDLAKGHGMQPAEWIRYLVNAEIELTGFQKHSRSKSDA